MSGQNGVNHVPATAVSPHRDLGAEAFTRHELQCPAQGELFRVLGRCLTPNQDAPTFLFNHEMSDAAMRCLANSLLNLLDEIYHKVTLHKGCPRADAVRRRAFKACRVSNGVKSFRRIVHNRKLCSIFLIYLWFGGIVGGKTPNEHFTR